MNLPSLHQISLYLHNPVFTVFIKTPDDGWLDVLVGATWREANHFIRRAPAIYRIAVLNPPHLPDYLPVCHIEEDFLEIFGYKSKWAIVSDRWVWEVSDAPIFL